MTPWETLGDAATPDGTRITLRRRGHEFLLLADGRSLMPSTITGSEKALAELGCRHIATRAGARVLIGGLGMGFTVRAALDVLPADARIVVAELVPEVQRWTEQWLPHGAWFVYAIGALAAVSPGPRGTADSVGSVANASAGGR